MEQWQFKKAYYLHAWLGAIALFIGLNVLLFNSPNYRIFRFALTASHSMLLIFLLLSLFPIIKRKFGLAIFLILLTIGFSSLYIFTLGIVTMFTPYDVWEYEYNETLKYENN